MHFHRKLYLALLILTLAVAGAASAQTLSIVSGDGQLARQFDPLDPMVVVVKDAQGQPLPGITVTWAVTGQGSLAKVDTVTDANGQASNQLTGGQVSGADYTQSTVTAGIAGSSVTFVETISAVDPVTGVPVVPVQLLAPVLGDVLTGSAGSTGTTAIVVQVGSSGISGVSHVLIRLLPTNPDGPTITCSGNTGYTDVTGAANCLPIFGGALGNGQYFIDVGGSGDLDTGHSFRRYGPFNFVVTQGQFAAFRITQGNNQAGIPGATLPITLMARTEDAAGNPVANVPVFWEAVVPNTVTVSNASTASDVTGVARATAKLGGASGTVQLRLRNSSGTIQALFTFQVNLVVSGISKVAGDNQDSVVNTAYAQPLIVQVVTPQGPIAGVQVQFATTGGVTLANGGIATTDSQGRASMNVTAGPNPGSALVNASVSGFSTSFNLTIRLAGPKVTPNSFFNGAGGQPGGVSPSAVLAIYGEGLATGLQGCVAANQVVGPLPLVLSNVTVLFAASNNYQAYGPLYAVCNLGPGQEFVTLQVPTDLQPGVTTVTVRVGTSQTILPNIPVTPVSPGIFETVMSDGRKRAVLVHANDGSYVTLENKARAGETLRAFVTGLGRPVTARGFRIGTNQGGNPADDASPQQTIVVGVANEGVKVVSTVYAPYMIGVYIVTFEVQQNPGQGNDINFAVAAVINDALVFGNPSKIPLQ